VLFQRGSRLNDVRLNSNKIEVITANDFKLAANVILVPMNDNPIKSIEPGSFRPLINCKQISLIGSQLSSFDLSLLSGMSEVTTLVLDHSSSLTLTVTKIKEVPESLSFIDMQNSALTYLDPSIEQLFNENSKISIGLSPGFGEIIICDQRMHWTAKFVLPECRRSRFHTFGQPKCKGGEPLIDYLKRVVPNPCQ